MPFSNFRNNIFSLTSFDFWVILIACQISIFQLTIITLLKFGMQRHVLGLRTGLPVMVLGRSIRLRDTLVRHRRVMGFSVVMAGLLLMASGILAMSSHCRSLLMDLGLSMSYHGAGVW